MATASFPKRYTQNQLTDIFAELSGIHSSKIHYTVWNNPKNPNSLRLSISGFDFVTRKLNFSHFKFELNPPLTNKNVLQLERYFNGMYFIVSNKFVVFDEQDASMLTLMDGDLVAYLNNLENASKSD